jgi:peptide deformylase
VFLPISVGFRYNPRMVLDIRLYPDPVLRQKCEPVTEFGPRLSQTIDDMFETMKVKKGVGLAAPQVGILQRIIVVWYKERKLALVNPEIVSAKGKLIAEEGCLSLPDVHIDVCRSDKIEVHALNKQGKPIVLRERGWVSRIIQHELDHLNGVLISDHQPDYEKFISPTEK